MAANPYMKLSHVNRRVFPQRFSPVSGRLTAPYGQDRGTYFHSGVDISSGPGDKPLIILPFSGRVQAVGRDDQISGNWVRVSEEPQPHLAVVGGSAYQPTRVWTFCHLDELHPDVRARAEFGPGSVIGRVGNSGRSTAPHLHLGLRIVDNWKNAATLKGARWDDPLNHLLCVDSARVVSVPSSALNLLIDGGVVFTNIDELRSSQRRLISAGSVLRDPSLAMAAWEVL